MTTTKHLIINSPYEKPKQHLKYIREIRQFELVEGRRSAGYVVASEHSKSFDDPGIFVELELANRIRERVQKWKEDGYPGITSITKDLLEHWQNQERELRFFFCQIEAIETLIWLLESPETVMDDSHRGVGPFGPEAFSQLPASDNYLYVDPQPACALHADRYPE